MFPSAISRILAKFSPQTICIAESYSQFYLRDATDTFPG
jgi:hypothetical protein